MIDPYVSANVLTNKLLIDKQNTLEQAESDFLILAVLHLKRTNFTFNNIYDCFTIHRHLFGSVFVWAGKTRTVDIFKGEPLLNGKSIDYVFASYINQAILDLNKEFEVVDWNSLAKEERIEKVYYFVSEFWHIHPFREGNTRTTAMMMYFLLKKAGFTVREEYLGNGAKSFRNALVLSCLYSHSKPERLMKIIKESIVL